MDLRSATFDEFVAFVFDHPYEPEVEDKWYHKLDADPSTDPRRVVVWLAELCDRIGELSDRFSHYQVCEGLHYLFGSGGGFEFSDALWDPQVPWQERYICIQKMERLYTDFLETANDDSGCAYMFWDWVLFSYDCGNRNPATNVEDARVQDAMFHVLGRLLDSPHPETQHGALHGLGHLGHRDTFRIVSDYLNSSRPSNDDLRAYAGSVLEGKVL